MADRFPSLDEIDAGQTEARGEANFDLVGDATDGDDFLTRERAALGEDADQFAAPSNMATVEDVDDDLLGGGSFQAANANAPELSFDNSFDNAFPEIDTTNDHMAPGGTITGSTLPYFSGAPPSSYPASNAALDEPEPEVIREWRERRDLAVQHRDEVSADRKGKTVAAAREAIDDFYDNYNNKKEKQVAQTKREAEEFLASRDDTTAGGTSWDRIAKLVDLSGKGKSGGASGSEKQRFRELLMSLRKDEKAPGATGY